MHITRESTVTYITYNSQMLRYYSLHFGFGDMGQYAIYIPDWFFIY